MIVVARAVGATMVISVMVEAHATEEVNQPVRQDEPAEVIDGNAISPTSRIEPTEKIADLTASMKATGHQMYEAMKSSAVATSTSGYWIEIGWPQYRHFPPRPIQLRSGTRSLASTRAYNVGTSTCPWRWKAAERRLRGLFLAVLLGLLMYPPDQRVHETTQAQPHDHQNHDNH